MASELTVYNSFKKYVLDGTVDLANDTLKLLLVTSDYTFDAAHDVLADVLSSPSAEVEEISSPSNGYTQGGEALSGQAVTLTDSPSQATFDADDVTWPELTATFRYAILYAEKTVDAVVNPLIACILLNTTPADIEVSAIPYTVQWPSTGIMTLA